jgi:aconitate hydratase
MPSKVFMRGTDYVDFSPDSCLSRCNCSNGLLQFMHAGKAQVAVPTTVHCDHLIQAKVDAVTDLARAKHKVMKF